MQEDIKHCLVGPVVSGAVELFQLKTHSAVPKTKLFGTRTTVPVKRCMRSEKISPAVLDNILSQNYPEVLRLGFSRQNLSSICGSIPNESKFKDVVKTISESSQLIECLKSDLGFTGKNLSSILSRSRAHCAAAIQKLHEKKNDLIELVGPDKFSANNISSMLSGSGANLGQAIESLAVNKAALLELLRDSKFSANNISSMLHGSGANVGQAIESLAVNKAALLELLRDSKFSENNISSMLSGSGANVGQAIKLLSDNKELLLAFIAQGRYSATELAALVGRYTVANGFADVPALEGRNQPEQNTGISDGVDSIQHIAMVLMKLRATEQGEPPAKRPRRS